LLALKAHQVAAVAPELHRLIGPDTAIVTLQNGVPWWYFTNCPALSKDARSRRDPDGSIARHIDNERIIGTVVYSRLRAGLAWRGQGDRGQTAFTLANRMGRSRTASSACPKP